MATYTKVNFSGSANGKGVKVAATSTPGTTIHTSHATDLDEIWLYLVNESANHTNVVVEWGGTTGVDNTITIGIDSMVGLQLVIPGLLLTNGCILSIYADDANIIVAYGFVNRIS
jgi:hypothetical protein